MIRTFIAAELPERMRARLCGAVDAMRISAPLVRWSRPDNLHLTFKFLGDVKESALDGLFRALGEAVAPLPPLCLEVRGVGTFPNRRHPRVVWAGCRDGAEEAVALAERIEDACLELGYEKERRPFLPHLTLGRIKQPAEARGLDQALRPLGEEFFGFLEVEAVAVFMSTLRRTGPVYAPMARLELAG